MLPKARPACLLLVDRDAQARAPLAAAVVDHATAVGRLHTFAEAMGTEAACAVRLISALHGESPAADDTLGRVLCECSTRGADALGIESGFSDQGPGARIGGRNVAWDLWAVKKLRNAVEASPRAELEASSQAREPRPVGLDTDPRRGSCSSRRRRRSRGRAGRCPAARQPARRAR